VTQAVIEPEPRGRSSAPENSDKEPTSANKPEVAEPYPLTAPEKMELEELWKLNQRLASGFYPMPYFEPGKPLTTGVAAGPEVQICTRPANAYGAYFNGPSFYSPPGYTQCVYPNGVQYTPLMEAQRLSRPDKVSYAHPPVDRHRKLIRDKSTTSYPPDSCEATFPDDRQWPRR